jgi:hypothetical protein
VAVDASAAYVSAARDEATRRGRSDAIRFVHADFAVAASELPSASIVTLDRVVCRYPSCPQILDAVVAHAERCLALSYPRDVWYVRAAMGLKNGQRRLARHSFRAFVHPVAMIEHTITRAGFKLSSRRESWMWSADVYLRQ